MLAPYQGIYLTPGMGAEAYSAEYDLSDLIYGSMWHNLYVNNCVVDGASRDAGNTVDTTVLRPGLVMAQITATQKWKQFDNAAVDGSQYARGILLVFGLNMQIDGANADRMVATILVQGNVYPEAVCLASTAGSGLARTGVGLAVRKHLNYNINFSDDFAHDLTFPLSAR